MEKTNIFHDIPYRREGLGRRKLAEEEHLLLMQAALKPGQGIPFHRADSNVHILVVRGKINLDLAGEKTQAAEGDLIPVSAGTTMLISNRSGRDASFLIIKTPHPRRWRETSGRRSRTAEKPTNPKAPEPIDARR